MQVPPDRNESIVAEDLHHVHSQHPRAFRDHVVVYPVVSRRSGGISIGINLNPDKVCNFDCVYCQVDRRTPDLSDAATDSERDFLAVLETELRSVLRLYREGTLFAEAPLNRTPVSQRILRDVAMSGDGEPTTSPILDQVVEVISRVKRSEGLEPLPIVLITNASGLDRLPARRALLLMDRTHGEVWAKLDAGTETAYQRICRTGVPFEKIIRNIIQVARERPVVIQSCFIRFSGRGPETEEVAAYCERLKEIRASGGNIQHIQLYSIARPPAEQEAEPLTMSELEGIANVVRATTGLTVHVYAS